MGTERQHLVLILRETESNQPEKVREIEGPLSSLRKQGLGTRNHVECLETNKQKITWSLPLSPPSLSPACTFTDCPQTYTHLNVVNHELQPVVPAVAP